MSYIKSELAHELHKLVGQRIEAAFYHAFYEGYQEHTELGESIQEVPALYLLLKTTGGTFFNVTTREYDENADLAGIALFQSESLVDPFDRPNHIHDNQWVAYQDQRITQAEVIEDFYIKNAESYPVPLGIKLSFANHRQLFVLNLGIHAYNEERELYTLYRGGESLTLFFSEEAVARHKILTQNVFLIQE